MNQSSGNLWQGIGEDARDECLGHYRRLTPESARRHAEASRWLPGGLNRNILHQEPHPLFIQRGEGARVVDVDGNEYLDLIGNYTAMVIGHGHPRVREAVHAQVELGSAWAGACADEVTLARMLAERIPGVEQVRFTASGTEATLMAVRAARAFTGRPLIAKFEGGYHGLHDYAMVSMAPPLDAAGPAAAPRAVAPAGVPEGVTRSMLVLPFNDAAACERLLREHARDLAGVLLEPVMGVAGVVLPKPGFLERLRGICDELGALLVFDEIISFRVASGGAQEHFGVTPDLTTLGKIIGGGYPVGAVGGRQDVMALFNPAGGGARVVLSGTFHANPVVLAAGIATLEVFDAEAVARLNERSEMLFRRMEAILDRARVSLSFNAIGSLFNLHPGSGPVHDYREGVQGDRSVLRWLYLALLCEGVLMTPRGMGALSTVLTDEDVGRFADCLERALGRLGLS